MFERDQKRAILGKPRSGGGGGEECENALIVLPFSRELLHFGGMRRPDGANNRLDDKKQSYKWSHKVSLSLSREDIFGRGS